MWHNDCALIAQNYSKYKITLQKCYWMCSQCTHGQGRSEQKPQSPKLPPAAAKYAPQPPAGLPRAQLAWGGAAWQSWRGGGAPPSAGSHTNLFTVGLSCASASRQVWPTGSIAGKCKSNKSQQWLSPNWIQVARRPLWEIYHCMQPGWQTEDLLVNNPTPISLSETTESEYQCCIRNLENKFRTNF